MAKIQILVQLAPIYIEVDEDMTEDEITALHTDKWMPSFTTEWKFRDEWRN